MGTAAGQQTRGFTMLPHTADKSVEAWGATLPDLFVAAAEAMFSLGEDLSTIERGKEWEIDVQADSPEDLLHAWLSELLWVSERDEATPCEFEIESLDDRKWRLKAKARGGAVPKEHPHTGAPAKAVTYHDLQVWRAGGVWRGHVVFDV